MEIKVTKDYSVFKRIKQNRTKNESHVKKLMRSFKEEMLITPITVNSSFEVIDGQHRLEVCKRLNLPVYYFVAHNYGESQMQRLNSNSKNWSAKDFVYSMCQKQNQDYIYLREFMREFNVSASTAVSLLSGGMGSAGSDTLSVFKEGRFKVTHRDWANRIGDLINGCFKYSDKARTRSFISAICHCAKNPKFKDSEFLHKLSLKKWDFSHCSGKDSFLIEIERVYNHKRQDKVGLRYF